MSTKLRCHWSESAPVGVAVSVSVEPEQTVRVAGKGANCGGLEITVTTIGSVSAVPQGLVTRQKKEVVAPTGKSTDGVVTPGSRTPFLNH